MEKGLTGLSSGSRDRQRHVLFVAFERSLIALVYIIFCHERARIRVCVCGSLRKGDRAKEGHTTSGQRLFRRPFPAALSLSLSRSEFDLFPSTHPVDRPAGLLRASIFEVAKPD